MRQAKQRCRGAVAGLFLMLLAVPASAQIAPYVQSFELLNPLDLNALSSDGWIVFGNVFAEADTSFLYEYGPFPAPNDGAAFCALATGQGGVLQGMNQLSVYNDYNNADHNLPRLIESNVYQEQTLTASEVGQVWTFAFDAKLGNIAGSSTALAFIKTIDPLSGFDQTNFVFLDMTSIPVEWNRYSISLPIVAPLVGQLIQFGFASTAKNFEASGIFYDNVAFTGVNAVDAPVVAADRLAVLDGASPNPFRTGSTIEYSLSRPGPVVLDLFDVQGRRVARLQNGPMDAGTHRADWNGLDASGRSLPGGVYFIRLEADGRTETGKVTKLR